MDINITNKIGQVSADSLSQTGSADRIRIQTDAVDTALLGQYSDTIQQALQMDKTASDIQKVLQAKQDLENGNLETAEAIRQAAMKIVTYGI
ncbi:MAG: hypothetical protein JW828_09720 [Sedimentisphaerales bacterium]|nr:hypothetical protein [Sedimentisphaerales bacterium]